MDSFSSSLTNQYFIGPSRLIGPVCVHVCLFVSLCVRTGGGFFKGRAMWSDTDQSGVLQPAAAVPLSLLLIVCCVQRCSTDSLCISMVRAAPKLPLPMGVSKILDPI